MFSMLNVAYLRPLFICYVVVLTISILTIACYPKNCDPNTDPLRCQCPPGPCGPYPSPMPVPPVRQGDGGMFDASNKG